MNNISPGLYKHYKGALYRVLYCATHTETGEIFVIYHSLQNPSALWARPLFMFTESVELQGESVPRFAFLEAQKL